MKVSIVVISKNEPALAETLESFVPLLDGLFDESSSSMHRRGGSTSFATSTRG